MNELEQIWDDQAALQGEIGLDPRHMTDADRAAEIKNLILGLHEEVTELGQATANYKRHILRVRPSDVGNVTEQLVDCFKYLITIAQLYGVSRHRFVEAFHEKSVVVLDKVQGERTRLERDTRLVCVDLDDCVADLSEWLRKLNELHGGGPREHHTLLEGHKDEFHSSGRFRDLPVIEGARDGLQRLKEAGYTIVIITARPHWQFKRIYADTLHWLDKHQIPRDLLLFDRDKVEVIHRDLAPAWPVSFIEDHPRNALALASARVHVLLYDRVHNREVPDGEYITRVRDWNDILLALNAGGTPR